MKKVLRLFFLTAILMMIFAVVPVQASESAGSIDQIKTGKLAGSDIYESGRKIALAYAKKSGIPSEVIMVRGDNFFGAMLANSLAGVKGCPVLITDPNTLSAPTKTLLKDDWGKKVTKVTFISGGFSSELKQTLKKLGVKTIVSKSFKGSNRYKTAELVAQKVTELRDSSKVSACIITSGKTPLNILSALSYCYMNQMPVLLANENGNISSATKKIAKQYDKVYLMGNTSQISEKTEKALGSKAVRVTRSNRYDMSVAVIKRLSKDLRIAYKGNTVITMGTKAEFSVDFVAGAYAGLLGRPILLINNYGLTNSAANLINDKAGSTIRLCFAGEAAKLGRPGIITSQINLNKGGLKSLANVKAGTVLPEGRFSRLTLSKYFTSSVIQEGDAVYNRIIGKSYPVGCPLALSSLRYLKVLHVNYDGKVQVGEMIVNASIAKSVLSIFRKLFENNYQIRKMYLVEKYWTGNAETTDVASVAADNTAAFNYRRATNSANLSNHAYGMAIDVNPLENPYVEYSGSKITYYEPSNAAPYLNRSTGNSHYITGSDLCSRLFIQNGFEWGGSWKTGTLDYQHFIHY